MKVDYGNPATWKIFEDLQYCAYDELGPAQRVKSGVGRHGLSREHAYVAEILSELKGLEKGSLAYKEEVSRLRAEEEEWELQFQNRWKDHGIEVPTRFKNPFHHWLIREHLGFLSATSLMRQCHMPTVLFGTIPSGEVNGQSIFMPSTGEYIIALDDGILAFLDQLSQHIVRILVCEGSTVERVVMYEQEEVIARLNNDSSILLDMQHFLTSSYFIHPMSIHRRHSGTQLIIASLFGSLLENFAIAHECAHVILGHLDNAERTNSPYPSEAQLLRQDVAQEFDADSLAYLLLSEVVTSVFRLNIRLAWWASDAFFTAAELLYRCRYAIDTGEHYGEASFNPPQSHPSPSARRAALRQLHATKGPKAYQSASQTSWGVATEMAVNHLCELLYPTWKTLHENRDGILEGLQNSRGDQVKKRGVTS